MKFASYPYQEFGTVGGCISTISEFPKDTAYLVKVTFPQGLITSSQKKVIFRSGMTASGEIVREDRRMFERFFQESVSVFQRKEDFVPIGSIG